MTKSNRKKNRNMHTIFFFTCGVAGAAAAGVAAPVKMATAD